MKRWILHIGCWVWLVMAAVPTQGMTLADSVASTMLRYCHPDDYVRACYRYGKILLNEQDNPVDAMKVFITASHVSTSDYVIMGRILSNIGTICRIANRHDLAYETFQRSANCFLQAGDSTLYYYGLNNMAFEKAVLSDKHASDSILGLVQSRCTKPAVLTKILETKAEACLFAGNNDSALYYAAEFYTRGNHEPLGLTMQAQAFYSMQQYDSAQHYANLVIQNSNDLYDLDCSYYILIHCDSVFGNNQVYTLDATRADVHKLITNRHGKVSLAVRLLEQDMNYKPDRSWLYAVIGTIMLISIGICIYIVRRKRQNRLLIQMINSAREEGEQLVAQNEHLQQETERRRADMMAQIEEQCLMFQQTENFQEILHWNNFQQLCEVINQHFFFLADKLKRFSVLNEQELRLCFLVLIGQFSDKQMADILNYSSKSIRTIKRNTAIKMNTTSKNLRTFLLEIVLK